MLRYGGVTGLKELHEKSISRLLSFGVYLFLDQINKEDYPEIFQLFEGDRFSSAAKRVCGDAKPFFEPGQVRALHAPLCVCVRVCVRLSLSLSVSLCVCVRARLLGLCTSSTLCVCV